MDRGTGQATQFMDGGSWQATIHRVAEADKLGNFPHSTNSFDYLVTGNDFKSYQKILKKDFTEANEGNGSKIASKS